MTTVPKAGDPPPPNNAKTHLIGDGSGMYVRPTAGGAASGDNQGGATGPTPGYSISMPGNDPSTGGYQVGPDMGHGATIVVPSSGDRPSGGKFDAQGGGTVGDSGPQGAAPASTDMDYSADVSNPSGG